MKRICIIGNSNLGAFFKYISLFNTKNLSFLIISAKNIKKNLSSNTKLIYISNQNNEKFNRDAYKIIKKFNPNKVILFYTRKINSLIFKNFRTINIHNSFLPNYKGLHALKRSYKDNVKLIISSSHYVSEKFDSGKIIHQIATPVKKNYFSFFKNVSFFQRVVLLEALINFKKNNSFSIINNETIICPGLGKKKINFKFWKKF